MKGLRRTQMAANASVKIRVQAIQNSKEPFGPQKNPVHIPRPVRIIAFKKQPSLLWKQLCHKPD